MERYGWILAIVLATAGPSDGQTPECYEAIGACVTEVTLAILNETGIFTDESYQQACETLTADSNCIVDLREDECSGPDDRLVVDGIRYLNLYSCTFTYSALLNYTYCIISNTDWFLSLSVSPFNGTLDNFNCSELMTILDNMHEETTDFCGTEAADYVVGYFTIQFWIQAQHLDCSIFEGIGSSSASRLLSSWYYVVALVTFFLCSLLKQL